mgnify:CR=1 FL=1
MATYKVRYRGQIYDVPSDRPPTPADMDRFVQPVTQPANVSVQSADEPSFLKAARQTEQKIGQRDSSIGFLRQVAQTPALAREHPFRTGLSAVAAPFEAAESTVANVGLGIQQRKPFQQIGRDVVSGIKGERPAQLGDIARASGIPFLSSEPVAAIAGLLPTLGTGLFTKTGRKIAGRVSEEVAGHATGAASLATVGSRAKLAQRVGSIPEAAREKLSERFGAAIDEAAAKQTADPSLLFDLQDVGQTLQSVKAHLSSGVRHAASDAALELADNPSFGQNVGLELARQVKAGIQRSPEINRVTEAGRVLRQARDSIRAQEVEKLGLGETFKEFGTGMKAYRQVQPRVKRLGVSSPVTSGLKGMTESEGTRKSLEHLANVGGKRQGFAEVLGAARTAGTQQVLGKAARFLAYPAAFAAGGYLGARKFLSSRGSQ